MDDLDEGMLPAVGAWMATAIGLVALVAIAEAGWNLGFAVYTILGLPLPLAVGFPVLAEVTSLTFAVQDLRDRRLGRGDAGMRAATHVTLAGSAAVNGAVGVWGHGLAGALEVLPPLVLAAVVHLHGDRASRAHRSRAVLRPEWRTARLREARIASTIQVLPILTGDDRDGHATVQILRQRLETGTLEPGAALVAAGWHDRQARELSESRLRLLETVAATVWSETGQPDAVRREPPARQATARPQQSAAPAKSATAAPRGGRRTATDEEILTVLADVEATGRTEAQRAITAAGISCGGTRLQGLLARHKAESGVLHAVN
jgi:hypothetical protein